ncbi:MAG: hypothetical protein Q8L98_03470 [Chlamydiales bacterium]|nr:hypothetical protein [Chlamydiales bacterium]
MAASIPSKLIYGHISPFTIEDKQRGSIRQAFKEGHFEPYQTALSQKDGREIWWDQVQRDFFSSQGAVCSLLYQFAVSIHPHLSKEEKKHRLLQAQQYLGSKEERDFLLMLVEEAPFVMGAVILSYGAPSIWEKSIGEASKDWQKLWLQQVIQNEWPLFEKKAFSEQFLKIVSEDMDADLLADFLLFAGYEIALEFNEMDWRWLEEKLSQQSSFTSLVVGWMIDVVNLLSEDVYIGEDELSESRFWLFFHRASASLPPSIKKEECHSLFKQLTVQHLVHYFDAFSREFRLLFLPYLFSNAPETFSVWIRLLVFARNERALQRLSELLGDISESGYMDQAIAALFDSPEMLDEQLTVYSFLDEEKRLKVLSYLCTPEREKGKMRLTQWIKIAAHPRFPLRASLKDSFAKDFYKLLCAIDSSMGKELQEACKKIDSDFVDQLLPIPKDPSDLISSQTWAIEELKNQFLVPGMFDEARTSIIRSLVTDLCANEESFIWIDKLFVALPKQTWPLIFFHFSEFIRDAFLCEKSEGGGWAWRVAETFCHLMDNPSLVSNHDDTQVDLIMEKICQSMNDTVLYASIKLFIEMVAPRLFIPVMECFYKNSFQWQEKEFIEQLFFAFDEARINNKLLFFARALQGCHERTRRVPVRSAGNFSLEQALWKAPFLGTEEEKGTLVKILIQQLGKQYLPYFFDSPHKFSVIKSLKAADFLFCVQLFHATMRYFVGKSSSSFEDIAMFAIFQELTKGYHDADLDVFSMLDKEAYRPTLERWFSSREVMKYLMLTAFGVGCLKTFNPGGFQRISLDIFSFMLTQPLDDFLFEFHCFLSALDELQEKEAILQQIEESPDLLSAMKDVLGQGVVEAFAHRDSEHSFSFLCKHFPDWEERLSCWAISEIRIVEDLTKESGEKVYYDLYLFDLYRQLQKVGKLESWLSSLRQKAPTLQEALKRVDREFLKKQMIGDI